jgi:hypothetical protein
VPVRSARLSSSIQRGGSSASGVDGPADSCGVERPDQSGDLVLVVFEGDTLTLASAYAGWTGSLPSDGAEQRLRQALNLSELRPRDFVEALLPTMFSSTVPPEDVSAFEASMRDFHPAGFRAMARAANEDLRRIFRRSMYRRS